jgi:serine/threonine protein kinase
LHSAGLAHSDLSYANVLIDPATGSANIIDIDGLVVPGKFASNCNWNSRFYCTRSFIIKTFRYKRPKKKIPERTTIYTLWQF